MAAVDGVRSCHATLVAATADTVTLTANVRTAELVHHGNVTNPIYFRTDGTAAVSAADENEVLLPSERLRIELPDSRQISVISAGAATYSLIATG